MPTQRRWCVLSVRRDLVVTTAPSESRLIRRLCVCTAHGQFPGQGQRWNLHSCSSAHTVSEISVHELGAAIRRPESKGTRWGSLVGNLWDEILWYTVPGRVTRCITKPVNRLHVEGTAQHQMWLMSSGSSYVHWQNSHVQQLRVYTRATDTYRTCTARHDLFSALLA
jgi:hypothetical protein